MADTLPAAATIAVRGAWTAEVPPELARVRVSVGARSGDRAQALRDVTRRADDVRGALGGYGAAVESVEAGALWVRPQLKDGRPRERVTGHVAGLSLTAVVVDPAVLGDLLVRLADRDMVSLDGPFWALRPDSGAYRRARTEAVRDARRRAEEYAAAAGARLTGLVQIADVGMAAPEGFAVAPAAMFRTAADSSVADELIFEVEPVPQTVSATVEARFTCTQPDFG
ncbi:SIMPL domain-containing protein [Geodermatophilus sp. SYSU D00705]